jgi:deoxynucleoside kinase
MSVISQFKAKFHYGCLAIESGNTCFDCSICLSAFSDALTAVGHNCQGSLGKTQFLYETCEYCKDRMVAIRQLQVLREGFKPLLQLESDLNDHLTTTICYRGPSLCRLYVDHLCVPEISFSPSSDFCRREHLRCLTCFRMFKHLYGGDGILPGHSCINFSCDICKCLLNSWSRLSVVSQVCTNFILDEHQKELNMTQQLTESGILRGSKFSPELASDLCRQSAWQSMEILEKKITPRSLYHNKDIWGPFVNIVVEGSIGAGKTQLLSALENLDTENQVVFVPEPIHKWTYFHGKNLLADFYKSPKENAFQLQMLINQTKSDQFRTTPLTTIRVFERAIESSLKCFIPILEEDGNLSTSEVALLENWYQQSKEQLQSILNIDIYIYLRADPATCLERIKSRNRPEEENISLDYLTRLHQRYEDWTQAILRDSAIQGRPKLLVIDANKNCADLKEDIQKAFDLISSLSSIL